MNLFEIVKYGVSCREAAERYGVEVNHYGMALCPFHNDRYPSLYVADMDIVGGLHIVKAFVLRQFGAEPVCRHGLLCVVITPTGIGFIR